MEAGFMEQLRDEVREFLTKNNEHCEDCPDRETCPLRLAAEGNEAALMYVALGASVKS